MPPSVLLLRRLRTLDIPSDRSSHTEPVLRGGGLALIAGALLALAVSGPDHALVLAVAVMAFAAIGLAEDVRGIAPVPRLALQVGAGVLAAAVLVTTVDGIPGGPAVAAALVVVWLVAAANAFNFMDGVNGISAVHLVVGGCAYMAAGAIEDVELLQAGGAALAAVGLAFIPWNAGRARVFLGDVGAYGLGAGLGALAAFAVVEGIPVEAAIAPLALYLADTGWTLATRVARGEDWLASHRTHVFQRLCDRQWSHQRVTLVTGSLSAVLAGLGLVSLGSSTAVRVLADAAIAVVLLGYLSLPRLIRVPVPAGASR